MILVTMKGHMINMEIGLVMENVDGQMELNMKVSGKIINDMVKALLGDSMVIITRETGFKISSMVKEKKQMNIVIE